MTVLFIIVLALYAALRKSNKALSNAAVIVLLIVFIAAAVTDWLAIIHTLKTW